MSRVSWETGVTCEDTGEVAYSYIQYLRTAHWASTRKMKQQRSKNRMKCEECKRSHIRSDIHHKHYNTLGKESVSDLIILCPSCHAKAHGRKAKMIPSNNFYEGDEYELRNVDSLLERLSAY